MIKARRNSWWYYTRRGASKCCCAITRFGAGLCLVGLIFSGCHTAPDQSIVWVEDSFADFSDGVLDAAGQNIYASSEGAIRTIHRFDLNQDGYHDLVLNNTHDLYAFIPATLGQIDRSRSMGQSPLAVEGSLEVEIADLNRDGFADLVFCPNRSGLQNPRRFVTIIWGGADGWLPARSNGALPVHDALTLVLTDLNADTWPDITVLNGTTHRPETLPETTVRIFWGAADGYLLNRRTDVEIANAIDLVAADFDGSGAKDLAVLTSDDKIEILWAEPDADFNADNATARSQIGLAGDGLQTIFGGDFNADGNADLIGGTGGETIVLLAGQGSRQWSWPQRLNAYPATQIETGFIDDDPYPDMLLCNLSQGKAAGGELVGAVKSEEDVVRILWGSEQGFDAAHVKTLNIQHAAAGAIADSDADGHRDIVLAVHQGPTHFKSESVVLYGDSDRNFIRSASTFKTEGPTDVAVWTDPSERVAKVVFANSGGGVLDEKVPIDVYWGGKKGFSPENRWEIPFQSGIESSAADINTDGFVDLIIMNSGHAGAAAEASDTLGVNILWGGAEGFDIANRRQVLREQQMATSNFADFNKDGYLDLVVGSYNPFLAVYYGGEKGFSKDSRVELPSEARSNGGIVADYNKDSWLDIAVSTFQGDCVRIFWGSQAGFAPERQQAIPALRVIGLEAADLNNDGWLDIIAGSYEDPLEKRRDVGTHIFWGSADGYSAVNSQWLPGRTPLGYCVADFDDDGFLDIFSPHYHGELFREAVPCYLYWGSETGYHPRHRTTLICDSSDDAFAADFDHDGRLDLFVACHSRDGSHYTNSKLFYNDGRRFTNPKVDLLPSRGVHWLWLQDMGHIYHRGFSQFYASSVFTWEQPCVRANVSVTADNPKNTETQVYLRSAASTVTLTDRPWQKIAKGSFRMPPDHRCLQYKLVLVSENGDRYPIVDKVKVTLVKK